MLFQSDQLYFHNFLTHPLNIVKQLVWNIDTTFSQPKIFSQKKLESKSVSENIIYLRLAISSSVHNFYNSSSRFAVHIFHLLAAMKGHRLKCLNILVSMKTQKLIFTAVKFTCGSLFLQWLNTAETILLIHLHLPCYHWLPHLCVEWNSKFFQKMLLIESLLRKFNYHKLSRAFPMKMMARSLILVSFSVPLCDQ